MATLSTIKRRRAALRLLFIWTASVIVMAVALAPFVWLVLTSLKPEKDIFKAVFEYWPSNPTLENYRVIFGRMGFARYFRNSFIVAGASTLAGLVVSISASYAFSRFRFRARRSLMVTFLIIPMFPAVLLLIPIYASLRTAGLLNTYWALIIAYCTFTIPFSTWMLTGFLDALPTDMEEAAMIDGSTRTGAFFRVLLPVALPGIAATALYIFIAAWNEYLFAVMLASKETVRTLPVALQYFVGEFTINWGMLAAGGVVVTLPVVLVFLLLQRYLIRGLTAGAVKG